MTSYMNAPDLEAGSDNLEELLEAKEWASYRATTIFEDLPPNATRVDFIGTLRGAFPALAPRLAGRIVDDVIRRRARRPILPQYGPHPTDIFARVARTKPTDDEIRLRRLAIGMYLEKRATRPLLRLAAKDGNLVLKTESKAEPAPGPLDSPPKLDSEERRAAMGLPSGLLRTVDYDPAAIHTAPTWLVKGLFPHRGLGMLVGESQAGKSFVGVHFAVCIARGQPLFGRKVKPGGVLYIAAEGGSGVLPRIKAADEAIGAMLPNNHLVRKGQPPMARAPIKVMTETPNLSRDGNPAALARTLRALHAEMAGTDYPLTFVVLDTLHAAMCGADEQSAADTGHALKPLRDAVEELGLFILIVHHFGKDLDRGARGSSAFRAAVDTEIELRVPGAEGSKAKPSGLPRRLMVTKQRDGAVGDELHCRLNTVQLGQDEDGEPWTTCTVAPCEAPAVDSDGKPKRKGDARLHRALEASLAEHGGERAPWSMVRGRFNNTGPDKETDGACRMAWGRALRAARAAGLIETDSCDQWIWFSKSPASEASHRHTP